MIEAQVQTNIDGDQLGALLSAAAEEGIQRAVAFLERANDELPRMPVGRMAHPSSKPGRIANPSYCTPLEQYWDDLAALAASGGGT